MTWKENIVVTCNQNERKIVNYKMGESFSDKENMDNITFP